MNQTESKAVNWLRKQGVKPIEIVYQPRKSPDFLCTDGRAFEVKKLQGNMILIYPKQWEAIKDFPGLKILVFNGGDEPVHIIPIEEIADCSNYRDYRNWTYWHTLKIGFVRPLAKCPHCNGTGRLS